MPSAKSTLVIGATGKVGRAVTALLAFGRSPVRAFVRAPETARLPRGVEAVPGDLTAPDTLRAALEGVDTVFLVWPLMGRPVAPVIDLIAGSARRLVHLSSEGVPDEGTEPGDPITEFHTEIERRIRATSLEWTFVRSGGMAGNALGWAPQIRQGDVVRWPYGAAGRALVHEADLADIAVRALTTDELLGAAPVVTGPAVLTQIEQVEAVGAALGRPLRWSEQPRGEARDALVGLGWPGAVADGALDAWAAMVDTPERVSPVYERLTGRPGRTFRQWADDHAADLR